MTQTLPTSSLNILGKTEPCTRFNYLGFRWSAICKQAHIQGPFTKRTDNGPYDPKLIRLKLKRRKIAGDERIDNNRRKNAGKMNHGKQETETENTRGKTIATCSLENKNKDNCKTETLHDNPDSTEAVPSGR